MVRHSDPNLKARLAAATALLISALSPSATWHNSFPVDGLTVANVLPLTESTNSPSMNNYSADKDIY